MTYVGATRWALMSRWYCAAMRPSRTSTSSHPATTRSVSRTSSGVGSSPAICERICCMRSSSASSISGSPAEMILTSIHSALRAMPEASAMTSGEDARTSRRNSLRASLSPAPAFSERTLSSVRRPLASSDISNAPGTSPLSFVFAVAPGYQVGCYEYLCRLRKLLDQGDQTLHPLLLRPLSLSLCPSAGSLEYVCLGADAGELPRPDVYLPYPLVVADAAIVVEPAVPALECHVIVLLQSRGIRKNVVHTNLRRWLGARSRLHFGAEVGVGHLFGRLRGPGFRLRHCGLLCLPYLL